MPQITIVLGNKNYSSWSLRGWLALKQAGLAFTEEVIPLYQADSKPKLLAHSQAGRVPILLWDEETIWDSLAIGEFLAERCPDAGLWPSDPVARAQARALTAEMHSSFMTLRDRLPMDITRRYETPQQDAALARDIERILQIWRDTRAAYGQGGAFLFGGFTLADVAFLPVATRFQSFGIELSGPESDYQQALLAWPAYREWLSAAEQEPWIIETLRAY